MGPGYKHRDQYPQLMDELDRSTYKVSIMKSIQLSSLLLSLLSLTEGISLNKRDNGLEPRVMSVEIQRRTISDPISNDRRRLRKRDGTIDIGIDNEVSIYHNNTETQPLTSSSNLFTSSMHHWERHLKISVFISTLEAVIYGSTHKAQNYVLLTPIYAANLVYTVLTSRRLMSI